MESLALLLLLFLTFKRQPNKMVKHTQLICRLLPTNCLSVFEHFVGLVFKGLNSNIVYQLLCELSNYINLFSIIYTEAATKDVSQ